MFWQLKRLILKQKLI